MSYPPRPPIIPGVTVAPMVPIPYPGMMPPMGVPMPPMMPTSVPPPIGNMRVMPPSLKVTYAAQSPPVPACIPGMMISHFQRRTKEPPGPPVTVFIGNITERAPDTMIRSILGMCGTVLNWKRVQGASGKLQAFGFCEFGNPDAGLRAIRLLQDFQIGEKKLVVKSDSKTQNVLDDYKAERRKRLKETGLQSPLQDENPEDEDYMDEDMKIDDRMARDRIENIISGHQGEMDSYQPPPSRQDPMFPEMKDKKLIDSAKKGVKNGNEGFYDLEIPLLTDIVDLGVDDEERKDIITREIGKFRDLMKRQEEQKEVDRKRREERDKDKKEKDKKEEELTPRPRPKNREDDREAFRRSRSSSQSKDTSSSYSNKIRAKNRDRRRSRSRSNPPREIKKTEKDIWREKEEEEENKERKKLERKSREKEAAYQERLRNWEARERKKGREHEKEKEHERRQKDEESKEARRLKEFLEDYDDDRDDVKYYKGRELNRRLVERNKEVEADNKDRQREKEELEELRQQIMEQGHSDPSAEFEKLKKQREEFYKPHIIIPPDMPAKDTDDVVKSKVDKMEDGLDDDRDEDSLEPSPKDHTPVGKDEEDTQCSIVSGVSVVSEASDNNTENTFKALPAVEAVGGTDNLNDSPGDKCNSDESEKPAKAESLSPTNDQSPLFLLPKKKKLDIKEIFNTDDDEVVIKKRKLVPIDYDDEKKDGKDKLKSSEEKRKHIKSIIDKIPTAKGELFDYPIDWSLVDNNLMEKRIKPWINKKIIDYIGEPEAALVDFICSKVIAGSAPQCILDDVQMVLDDEAEVFVVKMWRLLIYEIEAKKMGFGKS